MTRLGLIQPFREALASDWQASLQRDEWFFSRLEEEISTRLTPSEAFVAIDEVAMLIQQQGEPLLQWRCGCFLLTLARRSDTTEVPPGLRSAWESVERQLRDNPEIAGELRSW